jgi:ATP-dependent DNA helicase RecG
LRTGKYCQAASGTARALASAVRELLGADSRDARASLKRLRDAGFLQQVGQRGGATYRLDKNVGAPAAFRLSAPDLEEFVVSLAEKRAFIANSDVRAATGLDRAEALRVLDKLVREDRLRRLGERRGTVYIARGSELDKRLMD